MKKLFILSLTAVALLGVAHAEKKSYDFSNVEERKAAQQALSMSYLNGNIDSLAKKLQWAVDNNATYKTQASTTLKALEDLKKAL